LIPQYIYIYIHFDILLPSTSRCPKCSLPLRISDRIF
jgi:hypothetical protein